MWNKIKPRLKERILRPRSVGEIRADEISQEMRLVIGEEGCLKDGNALRLFLVVDTTDAIIVDCKYLCYGEVALIGALEVMCELVLRKNYDQAKRITADLIDKQVQSAFPKEAFAHLNLALSALEEALTLCSDIELPKDYIVSPISLDELDPGELADWEALTNEQRQLLIQEVIVRDIQPYIELDAGGVRIISLVEFELTIQYEGACTTCYAATGSTLSAIQEILQKRVHPKIVVIPKL